MAYHIFQGQGRNGSESPNRLSGKFRRLGKHGLVHALKLDLVSNSEEASCKNDRHGHKYREHGELPPKNEGNDDAADKTDYSSIDEGHVHSQHLLKLRGVVCNPRCQRTRGILLVIEEGNWLVEDAFEILLSIRT